MAKSVLITGASSGFGKETAKLFNQHGWNVIATMRSPEKEEELNQLQNVLVTRLDVQDIDSIRQAVKAGVEKFGGINALINNAGYGLMGVFESADRERIKNQYEVNVFGLMDVTQAVLPHLRAAGGGAIINISSFGGVVALPYGSLYNSTKFAVEGLSESLSFELAPLNIIVKIVEPGSVATNFRNTREAIPTDIADYGEAAFNKFFGRFSAVTGQLPKASATDVAATIYEAVTDGQPRLRYVVGDDAQFFIDLKMNNTADDFVKLMHENFVN
ncbi:MAG: SDR family oxidoreductase [Flavipsychrobacter sp.]|nr:SDR family oxidoreductase [Flavipsychrobacter sp.]